MFCLKCGSEVKDGAKFCPKCGQALSGGGNPMPQRYTVPQGQSVPQGRPMQTKGNGINGVKILSVAAIAVVVILLGVFAMRYSKNMSQDENKFIGTWSATLTTGDTLTDSGMNFFGELSDTDIRDCTLKFKRDGKVELTTMSVLSFSGTYELASGGNKAIVTMEAFGETETMEVIYEDDRITVCGDDDTDSLIFEKVE